MFRRMFVAAVVGLCLTTSAAEAGVITSATYGGHTYYLLTSSSWTDAQAEAVTLGGNLVTINDAAEQAFVFNTFGAFGGVNRELWIGLNDAAAEGTFVWVSGEPVTYTNWSPGEPNNFNNEDYGGIFAPGDPLGRDGRWNDYPNSLALYGVVEVNSVPAAVPEPASLGLLGAGGLAVAAVRRRRRA